MVFKELFFVIQWRFLRVCKVVFDGSQSILSILNFASFSQFNENVGLTVIQHSTSIGISTITLLLPVLNLSLKFNFLIELTITFAENVGIFVVGRIISKSFTLTL